MESRMKFFLLAEESGWDCSAFAFEYSQKVYSSNAYNVLNYNAIEARKSLSGKAQEIVSYVDSFRADPKTVRDAFILDSTLNYMALHSFPEYYINPLSVSPSYVGSVSSIGDLIFEINGNGYPLNDIIMDETIDIETKKESVKIQVDEYLSDMDKLVNESLLNIKERAFAKEKRGSFFTNSFFTSIQFILINVLLLIVFMIPYDSMRALIYSLDFSKLTTYLLILLPIFVLINDLVYVIFHSYRARISEPFNYAKRFLRRNSEKVYDDISREKDRLYAYICGAITNKLLLSDDIRKFSKVSSAYVNFAEVIHVSELKNKRTYRALKNLSRTAITLSWIVMFIALIIVTLNMAFQIVI